MNCGLTSRETAYVICGGGHVAPLDDDVRAFRRWQTSGRRPRVTPGVSVLAAGKAQIESAGSICSNNNRRLSWLKGDDGWEGVSFWREYPSWFTRIILWWHPEFR